MCTDEDIVVRRFLRYAVMHTTSDPHSDTFPSTPDQLKFAVILAEELMAIGLSDVEADINGYVTATLPSNMPEEVPVVGSEVADSLEAIPEDLVFESGEAFSLERVDNIPMEELFGGSQCDGSVTSSGVAS